MNIHRLYQPFQRYFRTKRMRNFYCWFRVTPTTRVLDVGGTGLNWSLCPFRPDLTFLNCRISFNCVSPKMEQTWIIADGRYLPFKDKSFDIVYSNSVIEHLGDRASQQMFAKEIARVGRRYYVQTPNKRFPVEPHLLTPFIHYLPKAVQRRLLRNFTVWGWITRPTKQQCEDFLREVRLLDWREVQELFPDAEIRSERVLGLAKSLLAIKL